MIAVKMLDKAIYTTEISTYLLNYHDTYFIV